MADESEYDDMVARLGEKKHQIIQTSETAVLKTENYFVADVLTILQNAKWKACLEGRQLHQVNKNELRAAAEAALPETTAQYQTSVSGLATSIVCIGSVEPDQLLALVE